MSLTWMTTDSDSSNDRKREEKRLDWECSFWLRFETTSLFCVKDINANAILSTQRLPKIKEWIDTNDPGAVLIPFSGALESKLADMPDDEKQRYLDENKITR